MKMIGLRELIFDLQLKSKLKKKEAIIRRRHERLTDEIRHGMKVKVT